MASFTNSSISMDNTLTQFDGNYTGTHFVTQTGSDHSDDVRVSTEPSTSVPVMANATGTNSSGEDPLDSFYFYKTEQLVFLALLFVVIVVGNSIVLLAVGLSRRRHSRMHFFILHLAIADLLVGLVTVFADLVWKIYEKWYAGDPMCRIIKFGQTFVMFASTYMLVALSIDRYDAISRPLNFTSTWTRCKVLVGLAWFFSALFSCPMFFVSSVQEGTFECWVNFPGEHYWVIYFACVTASVLVLPALIITACYTLIIYIIWMNSHLLEPAKPTAEKKQLVTPEGLSANGYVSKSVAGRKGSPKPNKIRNSGRSSKGIIPQAKIRTVKMTFTIVLVFVLCWSPYFVFNWLHLMKMVPHTQQMVAVSTFIQSLAPLNSAANPIIYGIFSTRICTYLRQLKFFRVISKLFCCVDTPPKAPGASEFSNITDTDYTRRSPRFTDRTEYARRSPKPTETPDGTLLRTPQPLTSLSTNNIEMCHLILISVPRSQKGDNFT